MSVREPFILRYNKAMTVEVAVSVADVAEFFDFFKVDEMTDKPKIQPRFTIEEMDAEGEWQIAEQDPTFLKDLEGMRSKLGEESNSRDADAESDPSAIWLPDGFDGLWSAAMAEIASDQVPDEHVRSRDAAARSISDTTAIQLVKKAAVIHFNSSRSGCYRITSADIGADPGNTHVFSFTSSGSVFVDIRPIPADNVYVLVGRADNSTVIRSTASEPFDLWEPGAASGSRRCRIDAEEAIHFGLVLHNLSDELSCTYSLSGKCTATAKTLTG